MTLEELKTKYPVDPKIMAREYKKCDAYVRRYQRSQQRRESIRRAVDRVKAAILAI